MKHLILLGCFSSLSFMTVHHGAAAEPDKSAAFALAIHGGAGVVSKKEMTPEKEAAYRKKLAEALRAGQAVVKADGSSLDAVIVAIKILEDSPLFNAGKGAALTSDGTAELDASLMNGASHKAGAGAETFAQQQGVKLMPPDLRYECEISGLGVGWKIVLSGNDFWQPFQPN